MAESRSISTRSLGDQTRRVRHSWSCDGPRYEAGTAEPSTVFPFSSISRTRNCTTPAIEIRSPLFSTDYGGASGTLYTALYYPARRSMELRWPGMSMTWSLESFQETQIPLALPVDA